MPLLFYVGLISVIEESEGMTGELSLSSWGKYLHLDGNKT